MNRAHISLRFAAMGLAVLSSISTPLFGQAVSGTILGSIHDSSGAPVPKAPVTISNMDTGRTRTSETDSAGDYTAPSLPPGRYSVSVQMQGFKKTALSNLQV